MGGRENCLRVSSSSFQVPFFHTKINFWSWVFLSKRYFTYISFQRPRKLETSRIGGTNISFIYCIWRIFSLTLGENFSKDLHQSWNHVGCSFKLLYILPWLISPSLWACQTSESFLKCPSLLWEVVNLKEEARYGRSVVLRSYKIPEDSPALQLFQIFSPESRPFSPARFSLASHFWVMLTMIPFPAPVLLMPTLIITEKCNWEFLSLIM